MNYLLANQETSRLLFRKILPTDFNDWFAFFKDPASFAHCIAELEVGYSLLPVFRNQGYATEAAGKCKDFAFENELSESLISIISITNAPSANVALKNGMHPEKQTIYNQNQVTIFRIHKQVWQAERNAAYQKKT